MPGDSNISHEVEARLVAIEDRLDALEGGGDTTTPEEDSTEESIPSSTYSSRRTSKSKTASSSDLDVPETTE